MPTASANLFAKSFNIGTHGFSVWDVLRRTGLNSFAGAQANSHANASASRLWLVVEVADANNFTALSLRQCEVDLSPDAHGLGSTFGTSFFLSPSTATGLTSTKPTNDASEVVLYLGYVISANAVYWDPWPFSYLPSDAPETL